MNFHGKINERELFLFNRIISQMPTVEIVLCEDCEHYNVCNNDVNGWCNEYGYPTDCTYYCADAIMKRKKVRY